MAGSAWWFHGAVRPAAGMVAVCMCAELVTLHNTCDCMSSCVSQDLENVDLIMDHLDPMEKTELVVRLGWLNLWNPLKAEQPYTFDFSYNEHRMMFSMLLELAQTEKGDDHTTDEYFRWPPPRQEPSPDRDNAPAISPCLPNWQFHDLMNKWMGESCCIYRAFHFYLASRVAC